jgi:hypothetical protein
VTGLLLLFVAAADGGTPGLEALQAALTEALGPEVQIGVRPYTDPPPNDGEMASVGRAERALAVARLVWADQQHSQALVHILLVEQARAHNQSVLFRQADPPAERGRALGLVISSYLLPMVSRALPPAAPPAAPAVTVSAPRPAPAAPSPWFAEAHGAGGVALGGVGGGLGGGLGLRFQASPRWGLRLGLRARVGNVSAAAASLTAAALSAGVYRLLVGTATGRAWLALRLDTSLLFEALTHFSRDDPAPVRRGRLLPAAGSLLELSLPLGASASVHLAAGLELAAGRTDVFVRRIQVARLAPLRGLAELGFRLHF